MTKRFAPDSGLRTRDSALGAALSTQHLAVLYDEALAFLAPRPGERYIDCTVDGGGHAAGVLAQSRPDGLVAAMRRSASGRSVIATGESRRSGRSEKRDGLPASARRDSYPLNGTVPGKTARKRPDTQRSTRHDYKSPMTPYERSDIERRIFLYIYNYQTPINDMKENQEKVLFIDKKVIRKKKPYKPLKKLF